MSNHKKLATYMEELGWEFFPTGPEEWEWMLFDDDGLIVAREGDRVWKHDVECAMVKLKLDKEHNI